mgnify:CR=1 FL=1
MDFFTAVLGMGKTTSYQRYCKRAWGSLVMVSSPTFAIVNVYGEHNELCHFDMYRVESWDDLILPAFLTI